MNYINELNRQYKRNFGNSDGLLATCDVVSISCWKTTRIKENQLSSCWILAFLNQLKVLDKSTLYPETLTPNFSTCQFRHKKNLV